MTAKHKPTEQGFMQAEQLAGLGLPHEQIGALLGIDDKTLRKYYQRELKLGKAKASTQVAKTLYNKALSGDVTSCIWWTKAQMGWGEKNHLEHSGTIGFSDMSEDELDRRINMLMDDEIARRQQKS